ncbi:uncharacterized protein LOC132184317 [Corylus avellana]|uniref:uncharacterized protein LOC132184317 n=1 Tax=Corylus avellana TaxID=13451 RepID=UPI00286CD91C|nr:uncharacterized protein LOC132184317 [Corylus avellana]
MGKPSTILDFFKRQNAQCSNVNVGDASSPTSDILVSENSPNKSRRVDINAKNSPNNSRRVDINEFDVSSLEYDPALRHQIWDYDVNQPFCLPCFLFNKPSGHYAQRVFTIDGFKNWKKVRDGKHCAFLNHVGKDPNSIHRMPERAYDDFMNQSQHIENVFENFTSEQIANNRLQLKASIDIVRVLPFQGIAFRGRDESVGSKNRENFLEILDLTVSYNEKIAEAIHDEIGDAKFCILVDEARDESMKEQMAIVLRFVDKDGFVREPFFGLVHGYDGASNMRGGWNGLQALVSNDCPYAYYIHCFAHRLQLALVAASKEVIPIHQFFTNLSFIVNIVCASCNRFEDLRVAQAAEFAYLIEIDEIETGRGLNQISTLQRAGDTHWSSHLRSVSSLIKIFSPASEVIVKLIDMETTSSEQAKVDSVHQLVSSTKALIQQYRDDKWDVLLDIVKSFCKKCNIEVPDINARYVERRGRARHQQADSTIEQHYRVNIFCAARDSQLQELNRRFSEHAVELLILASALDPQVARKSFRIDDICQLVNKFYPQDFTDLEK